MIVTRVNGQRDLRYIAIPSVGVSNPLLHLVTYDVPTHRVISLSTLAEYT